MTKIILFIFCLTIIPSSAYSKEAYIPSCENICLDTASYQTIAGDIVFFLKEKFPPAKTSFNIILPKYDNFSPILEKVLRVKGYAVSFKNHDLTNFSYNIQQEDSGDIIVILNIGHDFRYGFIYGENNENQYIKTGQNIICENISKQYLGVTSDKNKRHKTQNKR